MMKKSNIAIATLMLCATLAHSAATEINIHRYQAIADNFINTNSDDVQYVSENITEDIAVVTQHKEMLEKELAGYQKSWMPTILKIVGTQLGIDAGIRTISIALGLIGSSTYTIATKRLLVYPSLLTFPTIYIRAAITRPMQQILNKLAQEESINYNQWKLATISLGAITILLGAKAAKHLFNKANSYTTAIERLENEVAHDTAIIEKLQQLQA